MLLSEVLRELAIWILLAVSLNFVVGKTSIWSVGHLAFYGIGALGCAATLTGGHGLALAILVGLGAAVLASLVLGSATFRLSQDFFVILSVALSELVLSVSVSWKGPSGFEGVPRPRLGPLDAGGDWSLLWLLVVPALALALVLWDRFGRLPLDAVCALVRCDENTARLLQISPMRYKLGCFAIGAALAGLAGCLASVAAHSTDPNELVLSRSMMLFAAVLAGGVNSLTGSVFAGVLLVALPRLLERVLFGGPFGSLYGANLSQLLFGLTLILIVRYRPEGLAGGDELQHQESRK